MKLLDDFFYKTGKLFTERHDGPLDKVVGGVQIAFGATGYVASKAIHKAQGPVGHWINKKIGMDPVGDCIEDCKYILQEGLDRFK